MQQFSSKNPSSSDFFWFDYSQDGRLAPGETIVSAVVTSTVLTGTDGSPSSMISGSASVSGLKVKQLIAGGVNTTTYALLCLATTSAGQVLDCLGSVLLDNTV